MITIQKLRKIFDRDTKIKSFILLCAIILGATIEMLALALISPFVSVLLDASEVYTNQYIRWAFELFGFTDISAFLVLLTFMLAAIYIFRGFYMYVLNWTMFRFLARRQVNLSQRLLFKLLGFSYIYHTRRNIADSQRMIVQDVEQMFIMITAILRFLTDLFMMLFILVFLLIVSPIMTLIVISLALLCALLYLKMFRKQIRVAGIKNRDSGIEMIKSVNQALGGIKEVKLLHRENYFQQEFKKSSDIFIKASVQYRSLDVVPKYAIETICFGGAFIILGIFILGGFDISEIVPQLSLFVLAAFRLLPTVSRQVTYMNSIMFNRASVDAVYNSLLEEEESNVPPDNISDYVCSKKDISVQGLSFTYPRTEEPVLESVSFVVPEKKSVAFVGPSGAGKTTLIDLILGVIAPDVGGVFYSGKSIHHHFEEWSKFVGYIPQQIYLLDESIRENVAFGIDRSDIDEAKVWQALQQAQLKEFVESLPQGLDTVVGDRGIRLSGGQRQRVGIARAMYEDPPILVLDEATSSLDTETEKAVMDAIMGFKGNKTMLIVAHRLSTIEHCDIIYHVENKKVTEHF
ncbi:MAG: ABC transporter ATP-binding protein/permease [Defluviitaleaceae bacterium]|nr:ABC transporter ATP-binding protein/permease [Defluviitaleaceae bacterium]